MQTTEDMILGHVTIAAFQALTLEIEKPGNVFILGDTHYISKRLAPNNLVMEGSGVPQVYDIELSRFIANAVRDPDCLGVVPTTEGAFQALSHVGLEVVITGSKVQPIEIIPQMDGICLYNFPQ